MELLHSIITNISNFILQFVRKQKKGNKRNNEQEIIISLIIFYLALIGAVLHTINVRLFPDQLVYIMNHAEDKVLFIDPSLKPQIDAIRPQLKTIKNYVLLGAQHPNGNVLKKERTKERRKKER